MWKNIDEKTRREVVTGKLAVGVDQKNYPSHNAFG